MKITRTTDNLITKFMEDIESVYRDEADAVVSKHKTEIEKELDNLRDEIVTRASLRIQEIVRVDDFGSNITISIIKDNHA